MRGCKPITGLGDPLLGPSAVEAVASGVMLINPVYSKPKLRIYKSQHPFLADQVGEDYVCNVNMKKLDTVRKCVEKALGQSLPPNIPSVYSKNAYMNRMESLFGAVLASQQ